MNRHRTNYLSFLSSTALFAVLLATLSCTNSRESISEDNGIVYENVSDIPGAYTKVSSEVRQEKEDLRLTLNQQLDKVDQEIEDLEDKSKTVAEDLRMDYNKIVDQLDRERERLVAEYKNIENATDDTWQGIKSRVEKTMEEVDRSVTDLAASLKR